MSNNGSLTIKVETITPDDAARMLGTMVGNRSLRQTAVRRYAREMVAGKWLLNGEAIKIDRAGRLIDGQHRMSAVLVAKVPVQMHVVRGVDPDAMATLDTGVGRSFYDSRVIAGRSEHRGCGPIARWWYQYALSSINGKAVATHQELAAIVDAHPQILTSAEFIGRLKVVRHRCTPGVQGFVHSYAAEKYDREMADTFMQDLNDGAGLAQTSPIFVLRRRLVDDIGKNRLDPTYVLAITIKAWNAWINGDKLQTITWRSGGTKPEDFPRFDIDTAKRKTFRNRGLALKRA